MFINIFHRLFNLVKSMFTLWLMSKYGVPGTKIDIALELNKLDRNIALQLKRLESRLFLET